MTSIIETVNNELLNVGAKPLFVPLKTEWFLKFEDGSKTVEYRGYGPRWNENTCRVGRGVTLSLGYSGRRLSGRIKRFEKLRWALAPIEACRIYDGFNFIAAIEIEDIQAVKR